MHASRMILEGVSYTKIKYSLSLFAGSLSRVSSSHNWLSLSNKLLELVDSRPSRAMCSLGSHVIRVYTTLYTFAHLDHSCKRWQACSRRELQLVIGDHFAPFNTVCTYIYIHKQTSTRRIDPSPASPRRVPHPPTTPLTYFSVVLLCRPKSQSHLYASLLSPIVKSKNRS